MKGDFDMSKITATTLVNDALKQNPNSYEVFRNFGMHCLGCPSAQMESIADACAVHGIDLEKLLQELNK
jgi:hybrid cluster-associated redox disulfide protein